MTITNNDDTVLSGVRLPLNLANQNNVGIPRHNNMSLFRFESPADSCAATDRWGKWSHSKYLCNTNVEIKRGLFSTSLDVSNIVYVTVYRR